LAAPENPKENANYYSIWIYAEFASYGKTFIL